MKLEHSEVLSRVNILNLVLLINIYKYQINQQLKDNSHQKDFNGRYQMP